MTTCDASSREQSLGFVATVCPDGTANVSPKGTLRVWDDEHLVFLHLHSPGTVENLRTNPSIEVNVVDPLVRKGYRFKGEAVVLTDGEVHDGRARALPRATRARTRPACGRSCSCASTRRPPLVSPAYDTGASEEDDRAALARPPPRPRG